uniref:Secreted protein n=1 Tax=Heterorhabditis bacteriophora TaxID=37862 RepID=A0A1I7XL70_HETBA
MTLLGVLSGSANAETDAQTQPSARVTGSVAEARTKEIQRTGRRQARTDHESVWHGQCLIERRCLEGQPYVQSEVIQRKSLCYDGNMTIHQTRYLRIIVFV